MFSIEEGELIGSVEPTVYVEETLENVDGEINVIDSKLMTKEEVDEMNNKITTRATSEKRNNLQ